MRKLILELGPVVLSYGCVLIGIIGIILDVVKDKTSEMIFFLHILMVLCWIFVSIKWTIAYLKKQKEDDAETEV